MLDKHLLRTLTACAALVALALAAPQAVKACGGGVICVDTDAAGAATGLSWTDAYTNVQNALLAAEYGDTIWVAEGVYFPDQGAGQTNDARTSTFMLRPGVTIYGGFAANETQHTQRNPLTHITVLSGDIDGNDWNTDTNTIAETWNDIVGDNAYHVVTGNGVTQTARLDGFTITAGHANASTPDDVGGGMLNLLGSPALANLTFSGNQAEEGGGMYNSASNLTLSTATFAGNRAGRAGGGICNNSSHPRLTGVAFTGNQAAWGGGMGNTGSNPTLIHAAFKGNLATGIGGGGMHNGYSHPVLINTLFSGNRATYSDGGGIYNTQSSPTLINVTLSGNQANFGGGVRNNNSSNPALTNCILWNNGASNTGAQLHNSADSNPTITYSDVQWNGGAYTGTGNLNANPRFATAIAATAAPTTLGDYRTLPGSPVMNAGDNSVVTTTADLSGNPRIVGVAVDMGAYEIQLAVVASEIFLPLVLRN
ncbi:MAG: hypothetical protein JXA21_06025 [Anaerolineae bacterium]|nr:hypothetical protein [Anaerolineae bacterium]